jgi:hypothetical protein
MKADEAAELMEAEPSQDRFKQLCAVIISAFAMMLAVTGLGGDNATKEALNSNIQASNLYGFFQAKNLRQSLLVVTADGLELTAETDPDLPDAARAALRDRAAQYRRTIARYESEPETQEGKKELLVRAKAEEVKRDINLRKDPYFDFAETFLQIAIVLISVSLLSGQKWLVYAGGALGVAGGLLMLNGFTLLARIPLLE